MARTTLQPTPAELWALARRQHGVVARRQLLEMGCSRSWIQHRIEKGRLHPLWRGVYAVGRPELTRYGHLMGAVLSCGPSASLSHGSAATLWQIHPRMGGEVDISIDVRSCRQRPGVRIHRRSDLRPADLTRRHGIPVTNPVCTLVDLANVVSVVQLESAINEADKRDLTNPEALRAALDEMPRRPGVASLRRLLDRHTFTLTDSELERRFLPLARSAGLPAPKTGAPVNGFKVDFYWPELGLVVETDGLRYHRTAAQQAKDVLRDQAHTAAGLARLRFTHAQVRYEPDHVRATLIAATGRLRPLANSGR